jgi:uncharacterized protein YbgA (DUF1722 family)/uncharacterized protein YbbK (DUF523 family)
LIRLGVSACLLGERVRYDGADKLDRRIRETLGRHFDFVPVCPEVAIGLGVPRPPIELVGRVATPRAVGVADSALDVTDRLAAYGDNMATRLSDISGYIFKARSPSCGIDDVTIRGAGKRVSMGGGVYATAFIERQPLLPVEDEVGLADAVRCDDFLERVFAYRRWRDLVARGASAAQLIEFHAAHKLVLMTHGRAHYTALGRLVAAAGGAHSTLAVDAYGTRFMRALQAPTSRGRRADALMHASGFLKRYLEPWERTALRTQIEAYRTSDAPLIAPVALLREGFRRYPNAWMARQVYLYPDADELTLRYQ